MKIRRLDVRKMAESDPPPVAWLIEEVAVRGMLTVLVGREGEGKSLLAASLAAALAEGEPLGGFACRNARTMIIDAENGEHEIHRRVKSLGLPAEGVEIFETEGLDIRAAHHLDKVDELLAESQPDLVVLDSFRSLWRGDENDSGEVAACLDALKQMLRSRRVAGLLLHHTRKGGDAYRGSSAIGGVAEVVVNLARHPDDSDRARRRLDWHKCRPAPEPDRRWLRLTAEADMVLVEPAEPAAGAEAGDMNQRPVRDELTPRVQQELSDTARKRADIARAVSRDPKDRTVGRILTALEARGDAEHTPDGWRQCCTDPSPR